MTKQDQRRAGFTVVLTIGIGLVALAIAAFVVLGYPNTPHPATTPPS